MQDDDEIEEDNFHEESDPEEMEKPHNTALRTHSFRAIGPKLQAIVQGAQKYMSDYTLFTSPFPSAVDILHLVNEAWGSSQDAQHKYEEINRDCKALVSEVNEKSWVGKLTMLGENGTFSGMVVYCVPLPSTNRRTA